MTTSEPQTTTRTRALHLVAGLAIFALMTITLGEIAEDVRNGEPLTATDIVFSNWLHTHPVKLLTTALWIITSLHSSTVVCIAALPLGLYLWKRRERFWLAAFWVSVYGGWALNKLLKLLFHRARPHFSDTIQTLTSYSFPSGHTMISTVFYGSLALFLITRTRRWPVRIFIATFAAIMILLVAFSRVYLGAHYLSDVLAAVAEGTAWVALCLTGLYYFWRR